MKAAQAKEAIIIDGSDHIPQTAALAREALAEHAEGSEARKHGGARHHE
jgi:hypothetical protein